MSGYQADFQGSSSIRDKRDIIAYTAYLYRGLLREEHGGVDTRKGNSCMYDDVS